MNFPYNIECAGAFLAARQNGASIKLFETIDEVPLRRESMVIGSIENTQKFFEGMGWKQPVSISLPDELRHSFLLGREMNKISFSEMLELEPPFFVKPDVLKRFDASIIKKEQDKLLFDNSIPVDLPVITSEIVNFESEYRCYILDGKILGICNYAGGFDSYPNLSVIQNMIASFRQAPIFYSLDVGVVNKRFTYLIECNDGWSLGNYGLSPKLYLRGLISRWRQILEQNPVIWK